MSLYKTFCEETFNERGALTDFKLRYEENFNFAYDVIDILAQAAPSKRALVWCDMQGHEKTLTFGDLGELSSRAARVFLQAGLSAGDRVMVVLKRQIDYWYVLPALHKIGAVAVPVTHMLTPDDFAYRLTSGDIKAVIAPSCEETRIHLLKAVELSGTAPLMWSVGPQHAAFADLRGQMAQQPADLLKRVPTKASDPLLMYFTSGTTGNPKAVIHDHTYPLAHIITAKYWHQVREDGLHFAVAETGWAKAAWGKMYGQWLCGSAVMVFDFDTFDPKQLTSIINEYNVTTFCAPPTVFRYLVKKGMHDMPSLEHVSTAGETLSPEIAQRFLEKTGLKLAQGYGQTESTLIIADFAGVPTKTGSMGKPSPLYAVEILSPDGSFAPDDELGEIVIVPPKEGRQHGIFTAYNDDEQRYAQVWRDGVYHTGDIGWRDEEGYFFFHGRADDVIKSGGYRIGPYEVEHVLAQHPAVVECSVIGVEDALRGQAVKAFVVLNEGTEPTSEMKKDIKEFCNMRMAEYKWIRFIEFVDELPKTISGKVRRVALREHTA